MSIRDKVGVVFRQNKKAKKQNAMESGDPSVYTIYFPRYLYKAPVLETGLQTGGGETCQKSILFCVCCLEEDHLPVFCEIESEKNPEQSKHINRQEFSCPAT